MDEGSPGGAADKRLPAQAALNEAGLLARAAASEERFAAAFRASPMAIAISTLEDGRYLDVNDRFLDLVGVGRFGLVESSVGRGASYPTALGEKSGAHDRLQRIG